MKLPENFQGDLQNEIIDFPGINSEQIRALAEIFRCFEKN